MIEHLTQKQVEDYCQHRLAAVELLSVSEHLGECEACRQQAESRLNGDAAFFALKSEVFDEELAASASLHLSSEQFAAYVDKDLSGEDLSFTNDHLSSCEQCALAIEDLSAFRNEIAPSLDVEYQPLPVSTATSSWWDRRVAPLFDVFKVSPLPAFGAALAILLLAVTSWVIWRATREPNQEIAISPEVAPQSSPLDAQPVPSPLNSQPEPVTVVAELNDGGGHVTLSKQGSLSGAESLPVAYQGVVKKALTTQRIERSPQLDGLSRPPSALMGADNAKAEFAILEPAGSVLLTTQPMFRWTTMENASGYVVEVYDSNFKLVTASPQLSTTSWVAPALKRGNVYAWQVKATKDGTEVTSPRPPAPQAKFRVLDEAKANELAKAKREYASSHLMLGLLYADTGLLKESEQEFRLLLRANPKSEIPRNLLRQVQALRRRTE